VDAFLARIPATVLVVLDEAYAEFVRVDDPIDAIATMGRHPNLVMLRTFSKAHGLADLRVGYCVADPGIIDAVRRVAVPFGVSGVAQAAAIASLRQLPAVLGRVDRLVAERTRVVDALTADGWQLPDAQGNFVWLPLGDDALDFAAAADRRALAVRAFAGDGVRISIGMPDADNRVLELCHDWRDAPSRVR
jgi:histidinol-phosphate aminotransferase